ncbi:MAG TPA: hypothetical protein DCR46_08915 [Cytophagales bacterium]|nr:hypothetical protein [Cytophagales bacterium]
MKCWLIIAFVAEMKMVANFWLRPGNTGSSNHIIAFLEDTFGILKGKTVAMKNRVWMDGLFFNSSNFQWQNVKT